MKTTLKDPLFQKKVVEAPILQEPEKCDETCIYFDGCKFPKTCKVLIKQKAREPRKVIP